MTPSPRRVGAALAALALSTLAAPLFASAKQQRQKKEVKQTVVLKGLPATNLRAHDAIVHALERLGYGPRPGDVDRVRQMGLAKWIDQQLHPDVINDSALGARLESFPTLTMSSEELIKTFPELQVAAQRAGMNVEEYLKQQRELQQQQAKQSAQSVAGSVRTDMSGKSIKAEPGVPQSNFPLNYRQMQTPQRIITELSMAKMDRAIYSERQLYEQMVDFWFNHFNVFAGKDMDRWMVTSYERDAIRPHAMGRFRDLLEVTAKSPAMLFYLDNWQSVAPEQQRYAGPFAGLVGMFRRFLIPNQNQGRGLNENYARELMELHTLGVDGGYTEKDVIEVARCFTGWTIRTPQRDPEFWFDERLHDPKPKIVLGHKVDRGGINDGEEVLDLLARDPNTAYHISLEIARHFVSDTPPNTLVNRMVQTYLETDGNIRALLQTMIYSTEFWSREAYRVKIKTPFELVVSAARAINADADMPLLLVQWTNRIGEPLYMCQPPSGYLDKAPDWVNTGALLNRVNYALALAGNGLRGVRSDVPAMLGATSNGDPSEVLNRAINVLLSGDASPEMRNVLKKQIRDPQNRRAKLNDPLGQINACVLAGLVLGSPDFQRR